MTPAPEHALLMAWLAADGPAERERVLAEAAAGFTPELADSLLALASAGPSYGADRQAEARMQSALLELVVAVADTVDEAGAASEARRWLAAASPDPAEREALLSAASRVAAAGGRFKHVARAEQDLASHLASAHRPAEAVAASDRAIKALWRYGAAPDEIWPHLAWALAVSEGSGQFALALGMLHQWIEASRALGDRLGVGRALTMLGAQLVAMAEYEEALGPLGEALALLGEMDDAAELARAHVHLFVSHYALGGQEAAARHLSEALRARDRIRDPEVLAELERQFGGMI